MESIRLYDIFKQLFPLFDVHDFRRAGDNSIKIITSVPGLTFIFTYKSPMEWRFETAEMFGNELAKENLE